MMKRLAIQVAAIAFGLAAGAGDVTCDFSESSTNTAGWVFTNVTYSPAGRLYFNDANASIDSPVFDYPVTQLLLEGECASANTTRTIVAVPMFDGQETADRSLWRDVTPGDGTFNHRLLEPWNSEDGVKAFRLKNTGRSGYVYFDSARVRFVSPPEWMYVSRKWHNAVEIAWETPPDAEKIVVELREITKASKWNDVAYWGWDKVGTFKSPSASVNIYYNSESNRLEIGDAKSRGYAAFANPPPNAKWLRVRACVPAEDGYGNTMPICIVGPDGTNTIARLELLTEMTDYHIPVSFGTGTESIVFWSTDNHKTKSTVMMEYARFADEYEPEVYSVTASATVTGKSSVLFTNLQDWSTYYIYAHSISSLGATSDDTGPIVYRSMLIPEWLDLGTRVIMR